MADSRRVARGFRYRKNLREDAGAFLLSASYFIVIFRFTFLHNSSLNSVTASMIDSGSLLDAYIKMSVIPINLNQNAFFHTSFYGGTYNLLNVLTLSIVRIVTNNHSADTFLSQLAFSSRLLSLMISSAVLFYFYKLLSLIGIHRIAKAITILFLICLPSFVKFSYEIHPEPLAMLFGIITLIHFVNFLKTSEIQSIYLSAFFGVLTTFCKQPFIVYLVFPVMAICIYTWKNHVATYKAKSKKFPFWNLIPVVFISAFISNSYAFLNPIEYITKLNENIKFTEKVQVSVWQSIDSYVQLLIRDNKLLAVMIILSLILLIKGLFKRATSIDDVILFACAVSLLIGVTLLTLFVRFYFISSYLLPLYPLALVIIALLLKKSLGNPEVKITKTFCFASVGVIASCFPNLLISIGSLSRDIFLGQTVQFNSDFRDLHLPIPVEKVIYSPTIPITTSRKEEYANTFAFDPYDMSFDQDILAWNPSLIILDLACTYCENDRFISVLEMLGYKKVQTINGISANSLSCTMYSGWSQKCIDQIKLLINQKGNYAKFGNSSIYFYQKIP